MSLKKPKSISLQINIFIQSQRWRNTKQVISVFLETSWLRKRKKSCYNCFTKFEFPNQGLRIGKWVIYGKWKKLLPSLNLQNVGLVKGFCFNFEILVLKKRSYKVSLFLGIGFGRGCRNHNMGIRYREQVPIRLQTCCALIEKM